MIDKHELQKRYKRNIKRYDRLLREDEDYDWYYLLCIIRDKLVFIKKRQSEFEHGKKNVDKIQKSIDALNRLIAEEYKFSSFGELNKLIRNDAKIAFNIIRDNFLGWWD